MVEMELENGELAEDEVGYGAAELSSLLFSYFLLSFRLILTRC